MYSFNNKVIERLAFKNNNNVIVFKCVELFGCQKYTELFEY